MIFTINYIIPIVIYVITCLIISTVVDICLYYYTPDIIKYIPFMYIVIMIISLIISILFTLLELQIYLLYSV